jgi:uncharacterized caspase-like protein
MFLSNRINFTISLFLLSNILTAQTVDKLRLVYDEKEIVSKQMGITVSNNGELGAFCYENKIIKIVNLTNGKVIRSFNNIHSSVVEIRFNFDGSKLISVGDENSVAVFDVSTGKLSSSFKVNQSIIKLAMAKVNNIIAIYQNAKVEKGPRKDISYVLFYDLDLQKEVLNFKTNNLFWVSAIDFHPTLNQVAIARSIAPMGERSKLKNIEIYDFSTKQVVKTFGKKGAYLSIAYNTKGDKLYLSGNQVANMGYKNIKLQYYDFTTDEFVELLGVSLKNTPFIPTETSKAANIPPSSIYVDEMFLLGVKDGNSFEVTDLRTKQLMYTTKSDKKESKSMNAILRTGIRRIYPLADKKSFLINAADDNICQIYNLEKNSITAYVFSDANDDFVTIGRDGRLDGNQSAIGKLYWSERKSEKRTPIESTFTQFFTPNLLNQLLSGIKLEEIKVDIENLKPVPEFKFLNPVVGEVEFRSASDVSLVTEIKAFKLEFSATDKGGGLSEIRVYQNGKLISVSNDGINQLEQTVKKVVDMELIPGDNTIKIVATNTDKIESSSSTIIKYTGTSSEPAKLFVMAIGINKYQKSTYDLNFAVADATGFIEAIKVASKDLFADLNVTLIQDALATKTNVLKAIEKIKPLIKQGDVFVFYYAGHGAMTIPTAGEQAVFNLVPNDVTNFYSTEMLKEKGISTTELQKISKEISAQKQLFIIDACQSGGAIDVLASRGALNEKEMATLARSTGTYFLTASGSDQLAGEFAALGHGVFTYAILQAFTGEADGANGDTKISVKELSLFVENAVPELSEKYKGQRQYPVSYGYGQDFLLVLANKYSLKNQDNKKMGKYSAFTMEELLKMKKAAADQDDFETAKEIKAEIDSRK